ncbi:MAG: colanic acid/amylovoran biosynthesis glycosyltransferase [Clostridiales bacterium]|jgi:glycosyltransferase involved in cell wall biosynthesis|nr:colanic acid/amylovoran biosynthesis glycosyltransferase [Clostridiales bacterium]MDK2932683.1 colanic acid/amylovoran biosynthesis glycosyltransferase [Clostridiales bacterium]
MKNIAVITDRFLPITQTFIYREITAIKNFNIIVLTRKKQNEELFPYESVYSFNNSSTVIYDFLRVIRRKKIKLIHIHFGVKALQYLQLKKISRLPFVISFHGYDASKILKNPAILSKYKKMLFPNADLIITVSQKLKDNLVNAGCPKDKMTVLWSGVNTEQFYYIARTLQNNQTVKVLSIARLTEKKGFPILYDLLQMS